MQRLSYLFIFMLSSTTNVPPSSTGSLIDFHYGKSFMQIKKNLLQQNHKSPGDEGGISLRVCLGFLCVHNSLYLHTLKDFLELIHTHFFFKPLLVFVADKQSKLCKLV